MCILLIASLFSQKSLAQQVPPPLRIALPEISQIGTQSQRKFELLSSFLKEYWQIWAIDNNRKVEFHYFNSSDAIYAIENNQVDVIAISVIDTPHKNLLLSIPYAKYQQKIYRKLQSNQSDGFQIGIHSSNTSTLGFLNKEIEKQYFAELDELLAQEKQFDALYSTQPWSLVNELEARGLMMNYFTNADESPEVYFHFAVTKNNRTLLYSINESVRAVSKLQSRLWAEKYFSNSDNLKLTLGDYLTNLSEQEKQYAMDNNRVFYPITKQGTAPYLLASTFSNISERGLSLDIANYITAKTGIIFKPTYVSTMLDGVQSLQTGETQVSIFSDKNKSYKDSISHSIPYSSQRFNLIQRIDHEELNKLDDLKGSTIAIVESLYTSQVLKIVLPEANFKLFSTREAALIAVAKGTADVFVGSPLASAFIIKQQHLANLTATPIVGFPAKEELSFAVAYEDTGLLTLLNRALSSIPTSHLDNIYAKWSEIAFISGNNKEQVEKAYRRMSYVLALTLLIGLLIFWIYYRQLRARKVSQQRVEAALKIAEAARIEAEHSAQAKVTFLARMSHEIRTPMNGVLGMAEALSFSKLNKSQQELLDTLQGSARNLLSLLNDILDFSKIDAGKLTLESVPVDIRHLTENIVNSFKHLHIESEKKTIEDLDFKLAIDESLTHQYYTDPTRLTQVLNNLLSNAVKFTDKGTIETVIKQISRKEVGSDVFDTISFSVKDSGIGIAKKNQRSLFTPFIQADSEITRKYGGTGLGLSISQEIIHSMGSTINLDSEEGKGSTFQFSLEFKQASPSYKKPERRKNPRHVNAPDDDRFDGIRVLVAEDNMVNVLVITAQLERLNIKPDIAENGAIALDMHKKQAYDVIISDCHMPVMDGFELARQLKHSSTEKPLWLIAVTADALSGAAEKCYEAGFDDYMAKPCPQEVITNKLNNAYRKLIEKND